jgi:hypothetical protein
MSQDNPIPKERFDATVDRLEATLADEEGHPVPHEEVVAALDTGARHLSDAPVQDFVPLLAEHRARDLLREQGFHANPEAEPEDTARAHDTSDERDAGPNWSTGGPHVTDAGS